MESDKIHPLLLDDYILLARTDDPITSKQGAKDVRLRASAQKFKLLSSYAWTGDAGLTDEEAAAHSGLIDNPRCGWWKRSSDLRRDGYITPTGDTRINASGTPRMVCKITDLGLEVFEQISAKADYTEKKS